MLPFSSQTYLRKYKAYWRQMLQQMNVLAKWCFVCFVVGGFFFFSPSRYSWSIVLYAPNSSYFWHTLCNILGYWLIQLSSFSFSHSSPFSPFSHLHVRSHLIAFTQMSNIYSGGTTYMNRTNSNNLQWTTESYHTRAYPVKLCFLLS